MLDPTIPPPTMTTSAVSIRIPPPDAWSLKPAASFRTAYRSASSHSDFAPLAPNPMNSSTADSLLRTQKVNSFFGNSCILPVVTGACFDLCTARAIIGSQPPFHKGQHDGGLCSSFFPLSSVSPLTRATRSQTHVLRVTALAYNNAHYGPASRDPFGLIFTPRQTKEVGRSRL